MQLLSKCTLLVVASGVDAFAVQPASQLSSPVSAIRAASPTMQFGFQNYDRTVEKEKRSKNPLNYAFPIATGSTVRARSSQATTRSSKCR